MAIGQWNESPAPKNRKFLALARPTGMNLSVEDFGKFDYLVVEWIETEQEWRVADFFGAAGAANLNIACWQELPAKLARVELR